MLNDKAKCDIIIINYPYTTKNSKCIKFFKYLRNPMVYCFLRTNYIEKYFFILNDLTTLLY